MSEPPGQTPPRPCCAGCPACSLPRLPARVVAADLVAGVTVCVVMIPSVIAYAGLMGLPPQHGLYAALVPLLVYPFFGSSRQVIVGPDIAISLLIASAIAPLAAATLPAPPSWPPRWRCSAACCCCREPAPKSARLPISSPNPSWSAT